MEAVVFEPMQQDVEGHHPPAAEAMFVAATQPQPMLLSHRSKDTQNCGSIPTAIACCEHPKENSVSQTDFASNDVKHGTAVNGRAARHVKCGIFQLSKGEAHRAIDKPLRTISLLVIFRGAAANSMG